MALPYRKMTELEDQMRFLFDKGEYPFSVTKIERKPTQKGDCEMLAIELTVMNDQGRELKVKDWIRFDEDWAWKFRHFAYTCGLGDKYEDDTIDTDDFKNKNGVVKLGHRENEYNGEIRMQNNVVDYIKPGAEKAKKPVNDFVDSNFEDVKF